MIAYLLLTTILAQGSAGPVRGETIDKIVAVVDGRIITLSDVRLQRVLLEGLGQTPPEDDRTIIEQLIEIRLLEEQALADTHLAVSTAQEDGEIRRITDRKGFSAETIREAVRRRLIIDAYIGEQFSAFALVEETEARKYYEEVFLSEARARNLTAIPEFREIETEVYGNIRSEKVEEQLKVWLEQRKRNARIEIL